MVTKSYKINADATSVFTALTNQKSVEQWTGNKAVMTAISNQQFSLWEGAIHGINVVVSPKKIVQKWKEESWSNYSDVTFLIKEEGTFTILDLIHDNIPESSIESIDNGWDDYYLKPLKNYVESIKSN